MRKTVLIISVVCLLLIGSCGGGGGGGSNPTTPNLAQYAGNWTYHMVYTGEITCGGETTP